MSCCFILCHQLSVIAMRSVNTQDHVDVGTATRQSHLHGVAFPIDQDALQALQQLGNKELAYVRLVSSLLRFSGFIVNPRCACAARVAVVVVCVCLSVSPLPYISLHEPSIAPQTKPRIQRQVETCMRFSMKLLHSRVTA